MCSNRKRRRGKIRRCWDEKVLNGFVAQSQTAGSQHEVGVCLVNYVYLLRQLGRLHFRFDNLQSDCAAAEVLVSQQLRAMANGEAAFAQVWSCLIVEAFGIAYYRRRRVCVNRWGRHLALICRCSCALVLKFEVDVDARAWLLWKPLKAEPDRTLLNPGV